MNYRELYTQCYEQIESYSSSSVEAALIKGLSKSTVKIGKLVEKLPVLGDTQADERLVAAGNKLKKLGEDKIHKQMQNLIERQSNFVRPFIENIETINDFHNKPVQLLLDNDNIYIATIS